MVPPSGTAWAALLLAGPAAAAVAPAVDYDFRGMGTVAGVEGVAARTLGLSTAAVRGAFALSITPAGCGDAARETAGSALCYALSDAPDGRIAVRATSGPDLARGLADYLRLYANMSFSWQKTGGDQAELPAGGWPPVGRARVVHRKADISYFSNVVTFSYTFPWHSFADWVRLIDWMALHGINLVLAYTGQEEIYRKVFSALGVADDAFAQWSNGPGHLAWSRGQSMHGVGGALPLGWAAAQWALQRQVLGALREVGIVPVLPAFQGNVPPAIASLYPTANISVQGTGRHHAAWLDATDPLFQRIGTAVVRTVIEDFGIDEDGDGKGDRTEHWWEADGYFASGNPPWLRVGGGGDYDEGAFVHARKAYAAMNATDPAAVWLYQGWIVGDPKVVRGYVRAVPPGRLIISDMWAEWAPKWEMLAEAGCPFMYGVLQNFGGNLFLQGNVAQLANGTQRAGPVAAALAQGASGVGAFPEGADQNSPYFSYLYDTAWAGGSALDPAAWFASYAVRRYPAAVRGAHADAAWSAIAREIHLRDRPEPAGGNTGMYREKSRDALTSAPMLGLEDTPQPDWYNVTALWEAWGELAAAAEGLSNLPATLRYDIVNTGREVLAKLSNRLWPRVANPNATVADLREGGAALLQMHDDADALLCSDPGTALSTWLDMAAKWGGAGADAAFFDWSARAQVSTWLPACSTPITSGDELGVCGSESGLADYSNKQWGGLVGTFYKERLAAYLAQAELDRGAGRPVNQSAYFARIGTMAWDWQHDAGRRHFPLCPRNTTDVAALSQQLREKYKALL
eukprot:TRINITY_DN60117_c0_g1_i1.p1 TRINITY_DN60117_c0_g1~~TRINITY_DN60117_c0_g1_i1.p1  ORF type:complete len:832 (+),score=210.95 TRINITY_DN60117_c0_g1_i1:97-2496(+)